MAGGGGRRRGVTRGCAVDTSVYLERWAWMRAKSW